MMHLFTCLNLFAYSQFITSLSFLRSLSLSPCVSVSETLFFIIHIYRLNVPIFSHLFFALFFMTCKDVFRLHRFPGFVLRLCVCLYVSAYHYYFYFYVPESKTSAVSSVNCRHFRRVYTFALFDVR